MRRQVIVTWLQHLAAEVQMRWRTFDVQYQLVRVLHCILVTVSAVTGMVILVNSQNFSNEPVIQLDDGDVIAILAVVLYISAFQDVC